jgi:CHAD domain-containing protein
VRQELLRLLDLALEHTTSRRTLAPDDVHEARKLIKRARAQLALLRPALDKRDYAQVNCSLRDAARCLASARDSAVIAQAYSSLREAGMDAEERKSGAGAASRAAGRADPAPSARRLRTARTRATGMAVGGRAWSSLGPGLRAVYRRGRHCVQAAHGTPTSEALHEWRKQVKRLWHVLEPFVAANPKRLGAQVRDARRLSEVLGEEHDLAMLEAKLRRKGSRRSPLDQEILARAAERRSRLARRALRLGVRLYAAPPKSFERDLHRDWEAWRQRADRS